ncbi:MAG: D-arabinono-1,4-lactone oxidase [Ilumatobacteraceae bacterium]
MRPGARVVRNWARNEACIPHAVHRPRTTADVATIVRTARREDRRVRVIGGGHSFTPAAMTNGELLSLDAMTGIVAVDRDLARVTVQAGIRLRDLNRRLAEHGLAMPNLGDVDVQSLAGAISTATHGTGIEHGNLATTVIGMEMVTGTGEIVRFDGDRDPGRLRIARVALGALGVVTEVTLQLVPAFRLHAVESVEPLDEVMVDVDAFARSADHAELYWMPGARRCQVKRNRRTDEPARSQPRVAYVRDKWIGENLGFGLVCRTGRRFPSMAPRLAKLVAASATGRELIDRSDKVFTSPRRVRFLEMEYGLPIEQLPEAITRLRGLTAELSFPPLFPVEVRVSAADDIPLSTGYGRTNGWIAVHQYRGAPYEAYFHGVEAIMREHDGRPHWGKLHFRTADDLRDLYPEWDAFASLRGELDPDGTFRNPYVDRVLG